MVTYPSSLILRIDLDGIYYRAIRAIWQGQILDVPILSIHFLYGVVVEIAATMER